MIICEAAVLAFVSIIIGSLLGLGFSWFFAEHGIDIYSGLEFGGISFTEYVGEAPDKDGNTRRFIAANDGHAFPLGTIDTFDNYYAPADFNETVNSIGVPIYAKVSERKHGRGYDLHTQSNPLPICKRPAVLVRIYSSN